MYIFYIEYAPFLLTNFNIKRAKGIEIGELTFTMHLNTISSNVFFTLKIMNFEDLALTKICSSLCVEGHECILYMI
jgi:hypothetical protein